MAPEGHRAGNPGDMRGALVSRTVVLVGWSVAVLWHGSREPSGIVVALALLMVWAAAFARDSFVTAMRCRARLPERHRRADATAEGADGHRLGSAPGRTTANRRS
jgi:hypothetical protein